MTYVRATHVIGGGDTGGAMAYVLPLLHALRAAGCEAQLLCLGEGGLAETAAEQGLPVEVLPMRGSWDPSVLPGMRRHLLSERGKVVHTHGMRANIPVRAILGVQFSRPAVLTTIHSDLALDYASPAKARAYVALDRLSAGVVDGFCCVSAELADRLVERGVDRSQVRVVHPGIDPEAMPPYAGPSEAPTEGGGEAGVVGTVARQVEVKDIGLLLEAAVHLRKSRPGVRVVIVGDGPAKAAFEQRSKELGVDDIVRFTGEMRPVWPAFEEFQVYALTSLSEGIPISILEAMWMGLPVVATAVGGIPEVVEEGVTGYLVSRTADRTATAKDVAERMARLLADADLRARMGAAGHERVAREFTTDAAARTTIRFYERVLAERSEHGGI
jgi:glycosyltransferase involved in cell wall biosynthesis